MSFVMKDKCDDIFCVGGIVNDRIYVASEVKIDYAEYEVTFAAVPCARCKLGEMWIEVFMQSTDLGV